MKFEFEAIGTHWFVQIEGKSSSIEKKVHDRVEEFESVYSRFRKNSLVTAMSQKAGIYRLPDDAKKLFSLYKKFYDLSSGLITPLIGQTLSDAGYDAIYSFRQKPMSSPGKWDDVFEYKYPYITIKKPELLDFGAGGKGYIVDIVGEMLKDFNAYVIDAGGDMLSFGKSLKIGLENPFDKLQVIGITEISNQSMAGSSGNRRRWGNFHHVINPQTLSSPKEIVALWVIAEDTFLADMLTTALYFMQPEKLKKYFDFEFLIIRENQIEKSPGFQAELFVK